MGAKLSKSLTASPITMSAQGRRAPKSAVQCELGSIGVESNPCAVTPQVPFQVFVDDRIDRGRLIKKVQICADVSSDQLSLKMLDENS
uniref:Uncharacterized protein n=1 Tax=Romanomermis culicivorax TaxID=13658 RepID=A0A915JKN6_ROMCU